MGSGQPQDPQSWNRYQYCVNNPLLYTDSSGLVWGTKSNGDGTRTAQWFETAEEMEAAGFTAMTTFLHRNPNGDGYLSFNRFANHVEAVSTAAVAGGLFNGITAMRQAGFTSRSFPWALVVEASPNALTAIYNDPKVQEFLRSQEMKFLETYSGVAALEFSAARAFSKANTGMSLAGRTFEFRFAPKHVAGTPQAAKEAAAAEAHVFNDMATLSRVESEIIARGTYLGKARGFHRYGLQFDQPIGLRIENGKITNILDYGLLKLRSNGLYHVTPRTGPGKL